MAVRPILLPWDQQPQEPAEIDWSQREAQGLVFGADVGPAGVGDLVTGLQPFSFKGSFSANAAGRSVLLNGNNADNWQWGDNTTAGSSPLNTILSGATQYTIELVFVARSTAASPHLFGQWNVTSGNHWLVQRSGTGLVWVAAEDGSSNRRRWDASGLFTAGRVHHLILSWLGGGSAVMVLDGVDRTSSLSAVNTAATSVRTNATALRLGPNTSGAAPNDEIVVARIRNRALALDDCLTLGRRSPWAILLQQQAMPRSVGGGGPVTHDTSGALAGDGAVTSGSASRTRAHDSTGALAGDGGQLAGSAARTREHATSGALQGDGAVTAGSADRQTGGGGPVTHDTTGALAGDGAAVAGSAARTRAHATTGVLVGDGAQVVGSAARTGAPVSHDTSGALSGAGAVVLGFAALLPQGSGVGGADGASTRRRRRPVVPPRIETEAPQPTPVQPLAVVAKAAEPVREAEASAIVSAKPAPAEPRLAAALPAAKAQPPAQDNDQALQVQLADAQRRASELLAQAQAEQVQRVRTASNRAAMAAAELLLAE